MREAIATELKEITAFNSRVYAAFTAPSNCAKPYCSYKILDDVPANIGGAFLGLHIFIYTHLGADPDSLVKAVKAKLDNVTLTIDDSPARYFTLEWVRTLADFNDDISNSLVKRLEFIIPEYRV